MAQLYSRNRSVAFRAFLLGIFSVIIGLGGWTLAWTHSDWRTEIGVAQSQPVPFSHRHHVGGLGIDCRYCHTTVEKSAFAGMPSTHICMSCHSQIWRDAPMLAPVRKSLAENRPLEWKRVTRLPKYVYFDHSAHVNHGVSCTTCHGDVSQMPLTRKIRSFDMRDCLQCHRESEHLTARPQSLMDCTTCHR